MTTRWRVASAWAAGTAVWLLGTVAVGPLVGGNPLTVAAQEAIEASPGTLATWAIETLGESAQPALVAGLGLFAVVFAAALGLAARAVLSAGRRRQFGLAVGLGVVAASAVGFRAAAGGLSGRWALATVLSLLPLAALRWLGAPARPAVGRRHTLKGLGGALGAAAGVGVAARVVGPRRSTSGPQPGQSLSPLAEKTDVGTTTPDTGTSRGDGPPSTPSADRSNVGSRRTRENVVVSEATTDAAFGFDFDGMPARVGTADDHYVVDKNISNPDVDAGRWSLSVRGGSGETAEYSFEDLLEHPEARDLTVTTVCISNTVGGDLISTAEWRAVPVRALLSAVAVPSAAVEVVTRAADGYTEALPLSVVRDREDVVLAVGVDGQTLPTEHGFPARLLIPGRYGMKSTKWVEAVEVQTDDHEGYWEQRGWVEEAVVNTLSYLRAVQRRGDRVAVGGVAYAGRRGVSRVEVSVDGGETWADADLEAAASPHAWRRWRLVVDRPDSGPMDVATRATDGDGNRQTERETDPHPGGSTGWHGVTASL